MITCICDALNSASIEYIPPSKIKCSQEYFVPGFNEHLKDLHDKAKQND